MYSRKRFGERDNAAGSIPPLYGGTRFERKYSADGRELISDRGLMPIEVASSRTGGESSRTGGESPRTESESSRTESESSRKEEKTLPACSVSESGGESECGSKGGECDKCGECGEAKCNDERGKGGMLSLLSSLDSDDLLITALIIVLAADDADNREAILILLFLLVSGR